MFLAIVIQALVSEDNPKEQIGTNKPLMEKAAHLFQHVLGPLDHTNLLIVSRPMFSARREQLVVLHGAWMLDVSAVLCCTRHRLGPKSQQNPRPLLKLVSGHVTKQRQFLSNLGASDSGAVAHWDCSKF